MNMRRGAGATARMRLSDLTMDDIEAFNQGIVKQGYSASQVAKRLHIVKAIIDRAGSPNMAAKSARGIGTLAKCRTEIRSDRANPASPFRAWIIALQNHAGAKHQPPSGLTPRLRRSSSTSHEPRGSGAIGSRSSSRSSHWRSDGHEMSQPVSGSFACSKR